MRKKIIILVSFRNQTRWKSLLTSQSLNQLKSTHMWVLTVVVARVNASQGWLLLLENNKKQKKKY